MDENAQKSIPRMNRAWGPSRTGTAGYHPHYSRSKSHGAPSSYVFAGMIRFYPKDFGLIGDLE